MTKGDRIRYIREISGMSKKEFSKITGIDESTLVKYEKAKNNPNNETLANIATRLNLNPDVLTDGEMTCDRAMRQLFAISREYSGVIKTRTEIVYEGMSAENEDDIFLSFKALMPLLNVWKEKYEKYKEDLDTCEMMPDRTKKEREIKEEKRKDIEKEYSLWQLRYPDKEDNEFISRNIDKEGFEDFMYHTPKKEEISSVNEMKEILVKGLEDMIDKIKNV